MYFMHISFAIKGRVQTGHFYMNQFMCLIPKSHMSFIFPLKRVNKLREVKTLTLSAKEFKDYKSQVPWLPRPEK